MTGGNKDIIRRRAALGGALKALRQRRGATTKQLAESLGISPRSYENFEAVRGRINFERVHQLARTLSADPFAIFAALELDAPDFAVHCADNKLMSVLLLALREFAANSGGAIVHLDPQTLLAAFQGTFEELALEAKHRAALASRDVNRDLDDE